MHSNTYNVDAALVGRKVELVFDPFDMTEIEVRFNSRPFGLAVPHRISRHAHPKAKPEVPEAPAAPSTGIDYLRLVDTARGYPRAVNNLAVQALLSAYADNKSIVDGSSARAAVAEVTEE
ncbi:hypothetical protein [Streptomyces sp. NPDC001927]